MKDEDTNWIEVLDNIVELENILKDKPGGGENTNDNK